MVELLDDPGACPHGNPIPGSANEVDHSGLVALRDVPPGSRATLRRLTEDLELELDVMRFFEVSGLMPGASLSVRSVAPDGTMTLEVAGIGEPVALGEDLSDNLWVERDAT